MLTQDARIERIADTYGMAAQANVVQEECAELIQAISKDRRYNSSTTAQNMVEEMADVYLTLSTLYSQLSKPQQIFFWDVLDKKLERQMIRIDRGE